MLSVKQRYFVNALVETGSRGRAGRAARLGMIAVRELLEKDEIQRAIKSAVQARLAQISPKALLVMERLATDENIPPAVRRLAAADILDRAGLVSQAALQLSKPLESLSEMPASELRALVERLESELFARARPIESLDLTYATDKPLSVLD